MKHGVRVVRVIAGMELKRFLRDRTNVFFVFIFPLLLVLVIGAQFGSGSSGRATIAGEDGTLRQELIERLRQQDVSVRVVGVGEMRRQVARDRTDVGLFVPDGAEAAYRAGDPVTVELVPSSAARAMATQQEVRVAVDALQLDRAQVAALISAGVEPGQAEVALEAARADVGGARLVHESLDELAEEFEGLGQFDLGAASQVLLFTFLSTLAGSVTLIQARRQRVLARTLAAPVTSGQALLGYISGRWTIATFQGVYIVVMTGLLFGVNWGNWGLSLLVLVVFAAVAAGVAMVLGSVIDNDGTATGLGVGLGLVLAGLGGAMVPLEIFPDSMRTVSRFTPHAWGYQAFADIQRRDGGLVDILPELGVLAGMAVVALVVGSWTLRRSLARAI